MDTHFISHGKEVNLHSRKSRVVSVVYCLFPSLSQWLAHQKTCPQCRERCLPRNVLKLFIDDSSDSLRCDNNALNPQELKVTSTQSLPSLKHIDLFPQDKLELHQNLLKHKGIESTFTSSSLQHSVYQLPSSSSMKTPHNYNP